VAEESIRSVLPHLSPQVAAMVQLQHLCETRPQEVDLIRPCEVDTGGEIWLYQPRRYKTEHFGRWKVIMLGPRAQKVFRPWLEPVPEACCSVPAGITAWQYDRSRRLVSPNAPIEQGRADEQRPESADHFGRDRDELDARRGASKPRPGFLSKSRKIEGDSSHYRSDQNPQAEQR